MSASLKPQKCSTQKIKKIQIVTKCHFRNATCHQHWASVCMSL